MATERNAISRRRFLGGVAASAILAAPAARLLAAKSRPGVLLPAEGLTDPPALPAASPVVASLLANIRFGDGPARAAAVKHAALIGTEALLPLGMVYAGADLAAGRAASEAMKRIAFNAGRPGAEAEAKAAADQLLQLASPNYPRGVRADALELLGVVGGEAETKPLAALIDDKDVGEEARMALQRIPGKASDEALRSAARRCSGDRRAAIELSLRHRRQKRSDLGTRK
jgi:hypothetical protein